MDEVVNRTKTINCLQRIGHIIVEMPESAEKQGILMAWVAQTEPILLQALEASEGLGGAFSRLETGRPS
jgi:hypothetical protein